MKWSNVFSFLAMLVPVGVLVWVIYQGIVTKDQIIPLEDRTVAPHETVVVDITGYPACVVGPEECPVYEHNKTSVFIPNKPGTYVLVVVKKIECGCIELYTLKVTCKEDK